MDEPSHFNESVRIPGGKWLESNQAAGSHKLHPYWRQITDDLQQAFESYCAYLGMITESGEVDHFVSKHEDRSSAYEWSNYRYAASRVNKLKGTKRFIDPFTAEPDWLVVDIVTLEFKLGPKLPEDKKSDAKVMCEVLNEERLLKTRRKMMSHFQDIDGSWKTKDVRHLFPLLADCYERYLRENSAPQT